MWGDGVGRATAAGRSVSPTAAGGGSCAPTGPCRPLHESASVKRQLNGLNECRARREAGHAKRGANRRPSPLDIPVPKVLSGHQAGRDISHSRPGQVPNPPSPTRGLSVNQAPKPRAEPGTSLCARSALPALPGPVHRRCRRAPAAGSRPGPGGQPAAGQTPVSEQPAVGRHWDDDRAPPAGSGSPPRDPKRPVLLPPRAATASTSAGGGEPSAAASPRTASNLPPVGNLPAHPPVFSPVTPPPRARAPARLPSIRPVGQTAAGSTGWSTW